MLKQQDRIAGIFVLLEFGRRIDCNVFLPSVVEVAESSRFAIEKVFLCEWLRNRELGKMTQAEALDITGEVRDLD